jgi:hypothetical protein
VIWGVEVADFVAGLVAGALLVAVLLRRGRAAA